MSTGGDIIITGGSCDLTFNDDVYPKDPKDPSKHKNKHNQKVRQIIVTGDVNWDSGDHTNGLTCEIHTIIK